MNLGERVKSLRKEENQGVFASRFGLSPQQISKIEKGNSNPSPEVAIAICKHYGCSLDWLWIGELEVSKKVVSDPEEIYKEKYFELLEKHNKVLEEKVEKQEARIRERPLHN